MDLGQVRAVNMELVCRMASKWEKVVDKAASITLRRKLIVSARSVRWWREELRQLVKNCRDCIAKDLNKVVIIGRMLRHSGNLQVHDSVNLISIGLNLSL